MISEYYKKWAEENKEKRKAYRQKWYQANKRRLSIRAKEKWNNDPEYRKRRKIIMRSYLLRKQLKEA